MNSSEFDYIAAELKPHKSLEAAARCVQVDGEDRRDVRRRFRLGLAPMQRTLQRFRDARIRLRTGKT